MPYAQGIMTRDITTVGPNDSAEKAIYKLARDKISGAPVVDDEGNLVGIISEFALLAAVYDDEIKSMLIEDLMTTAVMTVTPLAPLKEVAQILIRQRIRRVPVVDGQRLVGIVSRRDLLKSLMPDLY